MAEGFGVPVILNSKIRDGSLRSVAAEFGVDVIVFEGGEALRIDERVVKFGLNGAFSIFEQKGMLPKLKEKGTKPTYIANSRYWVRSPQAGMIHFSKKLGGKVKKGTLLGKVTDAFGRNPTSVIAPSEGIIIGISKIPLVNKGDAIFHVATFEDSEIVKELEDELNDYGLW